MDAGILFLFAGLALLLSFILFCGVRLEANVNITQEGKDMALRASFFRATLFARKVTFQKAEDGAWHILIFGKKQQLLQEAVLIDWLQERIQAAKLRPKQNIRLKGPILPYLRFRQLYFKFCLGIGGHADKTALICGYLQTIVSCGASILSTRAGEMSHYSATVLPEFQKTCMEFVFQTIITVKLRHILMLLFRMRRMNGRK